MKDKRWKSEIERDHMILALYKSHVPQVDIAEALDINVDFVNKIIKQAGIEINAKDLDSCWRSKVNLAF